MKIYEMKKGGRYGIGFIDPNTVNEYTWADEYYKKHVAIASREKQNL
mgnify:CR=1 FL=1